MSLEQLPDDIKLLVLEQLPNGRAFQSLLAVSSSFKSLYNSERKHVLAALLGNAKPVYLDALAALQCSMMMAITDEARDAEIKSS